MRPVQLISSALLCSTVVSAWPWTNNKLGNAVGDLIHPHKRSPQRVSLGNDDAATPNPTQATNVPTTAPATDEEEATTTGRTGNTGGTARTGTQAASRTTSAPATTTFDPRLPPGGIAMITPNSFSPASYYKIGDYVTFAWNYTSLSVTPSAIDILAYCSKNQQTYTLAVNQTIANETGAVTWDTKATATVPLLTETYTLIIHDSDRQVTEAARAGYLSTFQQFTFGMYLPQAYTPLSSYVCVTCSGAGSVMEKQSMVVVAIFASMAVFGATWFTGLGALV